MSGTRWAGSSGSSSTACSPAGCRRPRPFLTARPPEDYVARSIELAGGTYVPRIPAEDGAGARATMNLQPESFYAGARDADVLLYNAAIGGAPGSMDELLQKGEWLADFRAVRSGEVWCTEADLFQQSSGIAGLSIFTD